MGTRVLFLALAILMPPSFGAAASPSVEAGPDVEAKAEAEGVKAKSAPGSAGAGAAKPTRTDDGGEASAEAPAAKEPSPKAKSATQSKRQAPPSLDALREACYGGKGEPLTPLVRDVRNNELLEAMRLYEPQLTAGAVRALLRGGDETGPLLEVLRQALLALETEESRAAASACSDLFQLLFSE